MEKQYSKFQAETRRPSPPPPPGSWDCQVHVFGDPAVFPLRRQAAYPPPPDATFRAARKMHEALGVERGVIVQSTAHGTDHRILIEALEGLPTYRGIAIVDDTVSDRDLQLLHEKGVRGARFNFWKLLNIAPSPASFERSLARIGALGWHAKIHAADDEWVELKDLLAKVKIPAVIDHMGHPDIRHGIDQPAIRAITELLRRDNWWILISNADRISAQNERWDDVLPLARQYAAVAPDRALWCTDWPHVLYSKPMPNDADLMDFFYRVAPDEALRRRILVENPRRLFGT